MGSINKPCYFIGTPVQPNAVSIHFQALAHELIRRGGDVIIITPPSEWEPAPINSDLHVRAWPSKRPTHFTDAVFLNRLIGSYKPRCLVANFAPVNWMCIVGWMRRVPIRIAWYHTLSTQIDSDWALARAKLITLRQRKKLVYRTATHLAVNSQAALEDAHTTFRIPREKCKVWRNSLGDPGQWLALRSSVDRDDVIVCAGRFDKTKGQDVLLEAFKLCANRVPSTRIEFLGEGPFLESIRNSASRFGLLHRCVFRGMVSHKEVLQTMSRAKATVVPSRTEAFGLVNIESMSVGTPVIASAVGGVVDIVRDGMDGYLVPPADPGALAKSLLILLGDVELRQTIGQHARGRFLDVYERTKVVSAQADWLENLTNQHQESTLLNAGTKRQTT
jgi:glycosyltransferase involved in cell wall biosynthesis